MNNKNGTKSWNEWEKEEEEMVRQAAIKRHAEEEKHARLKKRVEIHKQILSSIDYTYLKRCIQGSIIASYFVNIAFIFAYYRILKPRQIRRWQRIMFFWPVVVFSNLSIFVYLCYFYPLKMYYKGKVRINPEYNLNLVRNNSM